MYVDDDDYYILNGRVYPKPCVYETLNNKQ